MEALRRTLLKALYEEYASAAVDLKNGIDKVLGDFARQGAPPTNHRSMSAMPMLPPPCLPPKKSDIVSANKVREAKVQFYAVPLGTAINGMNMHSLVTGRHEHGRRRRPRLRRGRRRGNRR